MSEPIILEPTIAIIGGGPAGLSLARRLAPHVDQVAVFERENQAGGIPRHSDHPGYGVRDRRRFLTGPAYARALVRDANGAGAEIRVNTTVTGWDDPRTLLATSPSGQLRIRPKAFVFATGARERPRPARMIPGDRPAGVLTTGQLQNLVHLHHREVGERAVVVGAELVSWSAVMTLREAGCRTEALISSHPKGESYALVRLGGTLAFRTRVIDESRVVRILGRGRVEGVEIECLATGERRRIACDTVVFTGDWVPDNELLRMRGVELDPASLAPVTDQGFHSSVPGIFTVGNVNHPVETADVVALEGEHAAGQVLGFLKGTAADASVRLRAAAPLRWVAPARFVPGGPGLARGRLVAWVDEFRASPVVVVRQAGREVARRRLPWPAAPGRAFRIPARMLEKVGLEGGDAEIMLQ